MFTALLDANVLVPVSLADTVLRAAEKGLFLPRWSPTILDEVQRTLSHVRSDVPASRIAARLAAMDSCFPEASVHHYERLLPYISTPDDADRHVVAAARLGHADVIVTRNLRDFPPASLQPWNLEAVDPDCFLQDMLDLFPDAVVEAVREQARDTRRPPRGVADILMSLERAGVPRFADELRRHVGG